MEPRREGSERRAGPRRTQPERRAPDLNLDDSDDLDPMGSEHLTALLAAIQAAQARDRDVYDTQLKDMKDRLASTEERVDKIRTRFSIAIGVVLVLSALAGWVGRPVVSALIGALTP